MTIVSNHISSTTGSETTIRILGDDMPSICFHPRRSLVFHWIWPMRRACNGVVTALVPSGLDTIDDKRREEADKRISRNGITMICWCRGCSYSQVPIHELRKRTTFILQYILIGEGKLYGFLLRQQMDWCELWRMERLLGRIWFLTVGGILARLQ